MKNRAQITRTSSGNTMSPVDCLFLGERNEKKLRIDVYIDLLYCTSCMRSTSAGKNVFQGNQTADRPGNKGRKQTMQATVTEYTDRTIRGTIKCDESAFSFMLAGVDF